MTYVLLFRELKGKQPGVFFARLPSLAALDQMNGRAIVVGFACLTVGMAVGLVWLLQAEPRASRSIRASRRCRSPTRRS